MAITFDYTNKQIVLTAPETTTLTAQDLINAIRDQEDSEEGIQYGKIADASGKADLGGGVSTGITIELVSPWQLKHYDTGTPYQATIKDGNLVGGLGGNPVAYVDNVQVKIIQSAAGTISTVTSGSGLDAAQDAKLTNINDLLDSIEAGYDHRDAMRLMLAAMQGVLSGAGTGRSGTVTMKDLAGIKDRLSITHDGKGNRTAVVRDVSD